MWLSRRDKMGEQKKKKLMHSLAFLPTKDVYDEESVLELIVWSVTYICVLWIFTSTHYFTRHIIGDFLCASF